MVGPSTHPEACTDPPAGQPVEYPCSDGKVLMETEPHARSIVAMRDQLETHYKARHDVYVAGSMAVYHRQGDPGAVVVPDLFVMLGAVHKKIRMWFLLWEEGGVMPGFVVEVASPSTSRPDATRKHATLRADGSARILALRPTGRADCGQVAGLAGAHYEGARATRAAGWHRSKALGLDLRAERWLLRFHDPQMGRDMLTHSEASKALQATASQRDPAVRERDAANQRTRELEA